MLRVFARQRPDCTTALSRWSRTRPPALATPRGLPKPGAGDTVGGGSGWAAPSEGGPRGRAGERGRAGQVPGGPPAPGRAWPLPAESEGRSGSPHGALTHSPSAGLQARRSAPRAYWLLGRRLPLPANRSRPHWVRPAPSGRKRVRARTPRQQRGPGRGSPPRRVALHGCPGVSEPFCPRSPAPVRPRRPTGTAVPVPARPGPRVSAQTTGPGMPRGPPPNRGALCCGGAAGAEAPFQDGGRR